MRPARVLQSSMLGWQLDEDGYKTSSVHRVRYQDDGFWVKDGYAVWRSNRWYVSEDEPRIDQRITGRPV